MCTWTQTVYEDVSWAEMWKCLEAIVSSLNQWLNLHLNLMSIETQSVIRTIFCSSEWLLQFSWQVVFVTMFQPRANDNIKRPPLQKTPKVRCPLNVMSPPQVAPVRLWAGGHFVRCGGSDVYNSVVSRSRHHPSPSHSVDGVLAESLAATFQNNSVSSHFHCCDSPCCLSRGDQTPVSFMRVSPSSYINLVVLMSLPLRCFKMSLLLFS